MKKICMVPDERQFWGTIEKYLSAVNAEAALLPEQCTYESIIERRPDLIIANARFHHQVSRRLKQYPFIVIKEGTPPVTMERTTADRNLLITGWPLQKGDFLKLTSRMLEVPPRKVFRTIIRIFVDDDIGSLAQTRDFSLTGMAFTTARDLEEGDMVSISLSLPDGDRRLRLQGQVMRKSPSGKEGEALYGVSMKNLSREDRHLLGEFVLST